MTARSIISWSGACNNITTSFSADEVCTVFVIHRCSDFYETLRTLSPCWLKTWWSPVEILDNGAMYFEVQYTVFHWSTGGSDGPRNTSKYQHKQPWTYTMQVTNVFKKNQLCKCFVKEEESTESTRKVRRQLSFLKLNSSWQNGDNKYYSWSFHSSHCLPTAVSRVTNDPSVATFWLTWMRSLKNVQQFCG